jgi:Zn-dependent protease
VKPSFRLGSIRGIVIGANWSVVAIMALVTLGLATGWFPQLHPGHSDGAYLLAGLVAAGLFLGSILAHELGHALVAQRNGVPVESITLWLFGGVASLGDDPPDAGTQFRIAAIGPAVSVAVAAAAAGTAAVLDAAGAPDLTVAAATWLAVINAMLAVFNLAPAAPLDGGRILRAYLWWRHGDPWRAALTASRAGRSFGQVLIALGLVLFVMGGGFNGLWLMFIGWFLINAARVEESAATLHTVLRGLRIRDVMTPNPVIVPPEVTAEELIEDYLLHHHFAAFPVGSSPLSVQGLVSLEQVRAIPPDERRHTTVGSLAVPAGGLAVGPDTLVEQALTLVGGGQRALVFDRGALVGILSPTDVVRLIEREELRRRNLEHQHQ